MKIKMTSYIGLFVGIAILCLTSCKKSDLSDTETGFQMNTVYKAESDGFLNVEFKFTGAGYALDEAKGELYIGDAENPDELATNIFFNSSTPIQKNKYWKVVNLTENNLIISWTPYE